MWGLLYKDLTVIKKDLLWNAIEIGIAIIMLFIPWKKMFDKAGATEGLVTGDSMQYVIVPLIVYCMIFITVSIVQSGIYAHDERKVWSSYIVSTPMGAKGQVLSKYYLTIGLSFAVVVLGILCDGVLTLVTGTQGSSMVIYVALFFIQIFMRAIEIPFIIRFGSKHGRMYKLIMISGITFLIIVYLLFGKIPKGLSADSILLGTIELLSNPQKISETFMAVVAIFPYTTMILYYLSYKISCKFYQKGVNTYDA